MPDGLTEEERQVRDALRKWNRKAAKNFEKCLEYAKDWNRRRLISRSGYSFSSVMRNPSCENLEGFEAMVSNDPAKKLLLVKANKCIQCYKGER